MAQAQQPPFKLERERFATLYGFELHDSEANTYTRDISAEDALLNLKHYAGAW